MRELTLIEKTTLAQIMFAGELEIIGGKKKTKAAERKDAAYRLQDFGLISSTPIYGGLKAKVTEAGAAYIVAMPKEEADEVTKALGKSEAQRLRQMEREHGQYAIVDPCEVCGKKKMERSYEDEGFNGIICSGCLKELRDAEKIAAGAGLELTYRIEKKHFVFSYIPKSTSAICSNTIVSR